MALWLQMNWLTIFKPEESQVFCHPGIDQPCPGPCMPQDWIFLAKVKCSGHTGMAHAPANSSTYIIYIHYRGTAPSFCWILLEISNNCLLAQLHSHTCVHHFPLLIVSTLALGITSQTLWLISTAHTSHLPTCLASAALALLFLCVSHYSLSYLCHILFVSALSPPFVLPLTHFCLLTIWQFAT